MPASGNNGLSAKAILPSVHYMVHRVLSALLVRDISNCTAQGIVEDIR
jgi:hypothetical protein